MAVKAAKKKRVKFTIDANKGDEVYVAGTFNNWDTKKNKLKFKDGAYSSSLLVEQGTHEYKFIVNGEWITDPSSDNQSFNEYGTHNSVVTVG